MIEVPLGLIITLGFLMSLKFIYLWQIKEYRLDRFLSYLKEVGIVEVLYKTKPHKAAKSTRNLLIILGNALLFLVLGILTAQIKISIVFTIIFAFLTPFLGFCVISITVFLTSFLSTMKREGLISQAKKKVKHSSCTFIAITGSYGKTTTKELLYQLLSTKFKVAKTKGTINTDIGIASEIINNLKENTQFFIAEIGAYKQGEIKKAAEIIHPFYAILTAIGNQHLDLFGSRNDLVAAKSEIFSALKTGGKGYLNKDIKEYQRISSSFENLVSFSSKQAADIELKHVKNTANGLQTVVTYGKKKFTFTFKLLGAHNLQNLLPAIAIASDLGIGEREIEAAVNNLKPLNNKLSIHRGVGGSTVVSDAGNSNVEGFISAIETLANFSQKQKIIVSKGIIELGVEKRSSYERILRTLNNTDILLFTTDKLFYKIDSKHTKFFNDEGSLLKTLHEKINKDTAVLIEGKFTPGFINSFIVK